MHMVNLHMHNVLMDEIATMFPHCTFISHASTWGAEHLAKHDNVFFEVVQYPDGQGSEWDFAWFADKVGRERLIFGADLPYYDYRVLQKTIEEAPIDDDFKDRIAHKNLEALIQRFKPDWSMPEAPPKTVRVYDPEALWAVNPENPVRLTVFASQYVLFTQSLRRAVETTSGDLYIGMFGAMCAGTQSRWTCDTVVPGKSAWTMPHRSSPVRFLGPSLPGTQGGPGHACRPVGAWL